MFSSPPSPELQPFDIKPPAYTDPLQTLAQMGQLRNQGLQAQQAQLGIQQAQYNLASTQALNRAYADAFAPQADGSMGIDKNKLATSLSQSGYGSLLPDVLTKYTGYEKSIADLQKLNQENTAAEANAAGNFGATLHAANDDPRLFHTMLTDMVNKNVLNRAHYAPLDQQLQQSLQADPTGTQARALVKGWADQFIAGSPTAVKAQQEAADTALKKVELPAAQAKADLQKQAIDAFQKDPNSGDSIIDSVLPAELDAVSNRAYHGAFRTAMMYGGPDAAQKIVEAAAAHASQIGMKTSPVVQTAEIQQAVNQAKALVPVEVGKATSIASATAPIEVQKAVSTAAATAPIEIQKNIATEKAKAALTPGVFSQIIDPASRQRAQGDAQKYTEDYITKMNSAQTLLDTINASRGGNQAAGGVINLEEVRSIVNRVTRQEIEALAGGGTVLRRVENTLAQATSGRMSAAQLNDLAALGNLQKVGAERAYNANRAGTQNLYGVTPPHVDLTGIVAPAGGPKGIRVVMKSGNPKIFPDQATLDKVRREHPELF